MIHGMNYEEFRRQLGKAGLSVRAFADLIKQTPNSITNYAAQGQVPPHLAIISSLMADMAEAGLNFQATLNRVEFEAAKPRGRPVKGIFGSAKASSLE